MPLTALLELYNCRQARGSNGSEHVEVEEPLTRDQQCRVHQPLSLDWSIEVKNNRYIMPGTIVPRLSSCGLGCTQRRATTPRFPMRVSPVATHFTVPSPWLLRGFSTWADVFRHAV